MNKKRIVVSGAAAITILVGVPAATTAAQTAPVVQNDTQFSLRQRWQKRQHIAQATFGKVTNVDGKSFTLTYRAGGITSHITVTTTAETRYKQNGRVTSSFIPAVGEQVVVMGLRDQLGNIPDAASVNRMVRAHAV